MKFKVPQYNLGGRIGALRFHAARAMFYTSIYSVFTMSAAAIRTIQEWVPWFTFPMLLGCAFLLFGLGILFEHVFVYKAELTYNLNQAWMKENPSSQHLIEIRNRLINIEKALAAIKGNDESNYGD